ncbi:MAG: histidine kinase [Gemmatimonadales bacterium]
MSASAVAAAPSARAPDKISVPAWLRGILAVPLEVKVLGANLVIVAITTLALLIPLSDGSQRLQALLIVFVALGIGAGVNYLLIRLALRPIKNLEQIARRVSEGRVGERVPPSLIADSDLAHLAATINEMLDSLAAGRERMRKLGAEVVYAQERERAQVARDLQESVAQTLAAASFQVAAAANAIGMETGNAEVSRARELLRTAIEEIRSVSRSLHPRVADDLGLPAALEALADSTRQRSLIDVKVTTEIVGVAIPTALSTTLYRVAQEALRNVERHADAGSALLSLSARPGLVQLEISDDGCGFDGAVEQVRRNSVLARMRERLSLAGGELHIDSTKDYGTRVVATVKLEMEAA